MGTAIADDNSGSAFISIATDAMIMPFFMVHSVIAAHSPAIWLLADAEKLTLRNAAQFFQFRAFVSKRASMVGIFYVMLGGACGAAGRHMISLWALQGPRVTLFGGAFPLATLACNLIGGFLMGILFAALGRHETILGLVGDDARLLLGVGLLGGFTTFSAFSLESVQMIQAQQFGLFLLYASLSVLGSICALYLGFTLMQRVMGPG